jgi:hypothetical protein
MIADDPSLKSGSILTRTAVTLPRIEVTELLRSPLLKIGQREKKNGQNFYYFKAKISKTI